MTAAPASTEAPPRKKRRSFPSAVTILVAVTVLVWLAALLIPPGLYELDEDGAPIAGTYERVESPLTFSERVRELVLSPINGVYGIIDAETGVVSTENSGALFGSIGVVVFIMAIGAFLSVTFATKSLEVAVAALARRLGDRGWLLIVSVMLLFATLGTTMGFNVETFGFYALLIPLMAALGYDRMVTAAMVILGALGGAMASTVNPFSIGVASGEAGVSIGDGIALRLLLWVLLVGLAIAYVLRYAARVRRDPSRSLVGFDADDAAVPDEADEVASSRLTSTQKGVLVITGFTFTMLVFSVIPWSSIIGATAGPAEDTVYHETATPNFAWELGWWFPELAMLFMLAALAVAVVARMGEAKTVALIQRGMADMVGPAIVVVLARGVAVIMNNTQTLDTVLNAMEQAVSGASQGVFAVLVTIVNVPLAILIPSSSGHATLAMPLLAPLSDFAGVPRAVTITAWQMSHGWTLLWAPTNVVVVAGLALARVGYDKWLRFVWPYLLVSFVVFSVVLFVAAGA